MIKVNNGLLQATKAKYQAEILECVATLEIYFNNAVAIGEHPDLLAEVDKYVERLESASGKLSALGEHFSGSNHKPKKELIVDNIEVG